jgi:hypothetical protein
MATVEDKVEGVEVDEDEEEEVEDGTLPKTKKKNKRELRKERKAKDRQVQVLTPTLSLKSHISYTLQNIAVEDNTTAATKTETTIAAQSQGDLLNAASVTDAGEPAGMLAWKRGRASFNDFVGNIAEKVAEITETTQDMDVKGKGKGKGKGKEKQGEKGDKGKQVGKAKTEYGTKPPKSVQRVDKVRWKLPINFVPNMKTEVSLLNYLK